MTITTELAQHKSVTIENVRERIAHLEDLTSRGVGTAVAHQQWELTCLRELVLSMEKGDD